MSSFPVKACLGRGGPGCLIWHSCPGGVPLGGGSERLPGRRLPLSQELVECSALDNSDDVNTGGPCSRSVTKFQRDSKNYEAREKLNRLLGN
ncbi:unnamed protein product [Clavelina lepadiformis]|uniref:Uncharacterized protein n=1 Tax=Clavelina lepadiformis TaxID=159417 RepID=A0ABP0G913_CLALP